jgi:agmatine deiminase
MIIAAMALGYGLRSLPDAFPLSGDIPRREAAGDPLSPTAAIGQADGEEEGFGPAVEDGAPVRMPGEFEKQDALLLGVNELVEFHPETLVEIVAALDGQTRIIALISQPEQEEQTRDLLHSRALSTDTISFLHWPAASMWVQDFGPRMVVHGDAQVVDFEYVVSGREVENQLPMAFAATFGLKIAHCHLAMEGGSCLSNGRGLCISSTRLIEQNQGRGHDLEGIGRMLNSSFGFEKWSYVLPIIGETTGHVDLFLSIGGPHTIFLAAYDPKEDRENAERMDANADLLAEIVADGGRPLEIIRVPQPAARDGYWRSYTNVIYANGVVIVPQFPDFSPELDQQALAIYRRAFPERRIVGIDASRIVTKRGGLHCLALSIPRMPDQPAGLAGSR